MVDEPRDHPELPESQELNSPIFEQDEPTPVEPLIVGSTASESDSPAPRVSPHPIPQESWFMRIVFPGIESLLWMLGAFMTIMTGSAVGVFCYVIFLRTVHPAENISLLDPPSEAMLAGAAGSQLGLWCFAGLGALLRFGSRLAMVLGLRSLSVWHFLAILGLTLPVQVLAQAWAALCSRVLNSLGIPDFSELYSEHMQELFDAGPLVVMWLLIAVGPALGEELVFRGLIGTNLVRRWGPIWGVLVTSVLFGIVHLIPIQAIAVIPLGMAMHYVYLTTKSFWAPVLLHLCNNSLALAMMSLTEDMAEVGEEGLMEMPSPAILLISLWTAICLIAYFWQTRRTAPPVDVLEVDDERPETYGEDLQTQLVSHSPTAMTYLLALMGLLGIGGVSRGCTRRTLVDNFNHHPDTLNAAQSAATGFCGYQNCGVPRRKIPPWRFYDGQNHRPPQPSLPHIADAVLPFRY